ncbi:hypothetical protein DNTS_001447 [Danionella cerebrum]|uniref:Uncharacterized protein n=1 Tax=Danionella cerebrum TaxID=2873325 RepID=A0A553R4D7_9TELE|nr:hypothetical protein DNTS_001447 [Danionella translucida]
MQNILKTWREEHICTVLLSHTTGVHSRVSSRLPLFLSSQSEVSEEPPEQTPSKACAKQGSLTLTNITRGGTYFLKNFTFFGRFLQHLNSCHIPSIDGDQILSGNGHVDLTVSQTPRDFAQKEPDLRALFPTKVPKPARKELIFPSGILCQFWN